MNIILNSQPVSLPSDCMSVADLVSWRNIKPHGTAIALNDKIVKKENWELTKLSELDRITVISAAFGG